MTRPKPIPPPDIDGAELLDRLRETIRRYVILPSNEALDAVTLWIAATHAIAAWACAPRLVIRAPEKRCGKSRLLDLVEAACYHPMITVNCSPAAVYRSIGTDNPPTLLIDEYDTIFTNVGDNNADLRGLLNAGHQRNRPASRFNSNTNQVEQIPTFAMAAMAGIGAAPETIEDRAVVIHMRRRKSREKVQPWRIMRDRPVVATLGAQVNAWLKNHLVALRDAEPVMPVEDRDADTWEPLIAVADLAGGQWPIRARTAAVTLTGAREETAENSERVRLLADCRTVFTTAGEHASALPTCYLIEQLRAMDDAPWADLNAMKFGVILKDFGIKPAGNIRFMTGQAKGYTREAFIDAWDRYLSPEAPNPPGEPSQPSQPSHPSSGPGRLFQWDGLSRPSKKAVPGLTSNGTAGTAGTATPQDPDNASTPVHEMHDRLRLVRPAEDPTGTQ